MIKHIHIFGASGSGTTTLGKRISAELGFNHLDTDNYYWEPTNPPYQIIRALDKRKELLDRDLKLHDRWVLSGSLCGWGDYLINDFDLAIFLYIPKKVRMKRLEEREKKLYGDKILKGHEQHEIYLKLMKWAAEYDEGGLDIRSKALHYQWMEKLKCKTLRIEEVISMEEKMKLVKDIIGDIS